MSLVLVAGLSVLLALGPGAAEKKKTTVPPGVPAPTEEVAPPAPFVRVIGDHRKETAAGLASRPDGGAIVLERVASTSGAEVVRSFRLNPAGKLYPGVVLDDRGKLTPVGVVADGADGALAAGTLTVGRKRQIGVLYRLSPDGTPVWLARYFGGPEAEKSGEVAFRGLAARPEGGAVLTGMARPDKDAPWRGYAVAVDGAGAILWETTFQRDEGLRLTHSVPHADGTTVLLGDVVPDPATPAQHVVAIALDPRGKPGTRARLAGGTGRDRLVGAASNGRSGAYVLYEVGDGDGTTVDPLIVAEWAADGTQTERARYSAGAGEGPRPWQITPDGASGAVLVGTAVQTAGSGKYDLWSAHLPAEGLVGTPQVWGTLPRGEVPAFVVPRATGGFLVSGQSGADHLILTLDPQGHFPPNERNPNRR